MKIIFYWIGGATFILSIENLNIAVDPVSCEKGTWSLKKCFSSIQ